MINLKRLKKAVKTVAVEMLAFICLIKAIKVTYLICIAGGTFRLYLQGSSAYVGFVGLILLTFKMLTDHDN